MSRHSIGAGAATLCCWVHPLGEPEYFCFSGFPSSEDLNPSGDKLINEARYIADAPPGQGRRVAHADCAQCHGVDRNSYSSNLAAPTFDDIANVPGMTSQALIVALRTPHRSMPNLVIKGRDAEDLVAYILSLKRN